MNPNHCDGCRLIILMIETINEKNKLIEEFKKRKPKKSNPNQQSLDFGDFKLN